MTRTRLPLPSSAASALWSIATVTLTLAAMTAQAQTTPPLRKYVGSPDYPALLKEPAVKAKLQAAMLSKKRITVFAKDKRYDSLMICIKDWITQVNSGHRDRFAQPKNVQFGSPS